MLLYTSEGVFGIIFFYNPFLRLVQGLTNSTSLHGAGLRQKANFTQHFHTPLGGISP